MIAFDALALAHGWLAVAVAAATDKNAPAQLFKTVLIEEHETGVRLYATDRFVLLTAWVPALEHEDDDRVPPIDVLPARTVIACDADGLGRHVLGYALSLANRIVNDKDAVYEPGMVEVRLDLDAPPPAGATVDDAFDGLASPYVVLEIPETESVHLPVVMAAAPEWRNIIGGFDGEETKHISLNPELLERIGKVRRHAAGPLVWSFGGAGRTALIDWPESTPHIEGAVAPRKPDDHDDEVPDDEGGVR